MTAGICMISIGDRMKSYYEDRYRIFLTRRTPVIVRLDGKAFHSLTKHCKRPFDSNFIHSMLNGAMAVSDETQGFKLAYIQSDEANFLLTDYDTLQTEAYFDNNLQKIITIMASQMSVQFSHQFGKVGYFDGRAFNIPESEIANCFLWRALDWQRNSIQMYAQSFFSHKQLHGKNQSDMHEMLYGIGKNWATDLGEAEKNGIFITKEKCYLNIGPSYEDINNLVEKVLKTDNPELLE